MSGFSLVRTRQVLEAIEDAMAGLPGVVAVTTSRTRVLSGGASTSEFRLQGLPDDANADYGAYYNFIGPEYLRTMGIALVAGRDFSRSDSVDMPRVAIVNETFLRKYQLGREAIGMQMYRSGREGVPITIVGVAADFVYDDVKGRQNPVVLMPYRQDPDVAGANFYVRTQAGETDLLAAIPGVVRRVDSTLALDGLRTMNAQAQANVGLDRFVTSLSAMFAALATLLAALGLYGVVAYTVTQRTREFGLRMALGARAVDVRRLVLRQVSLMTAAGTAIGAVSALALGRAAESMLFRMNGRDPIVFASAVLVLAAVALCAGWIPAQRAARIDPLNALRYE
jgi:predicted permease